ncbi:DUF4349 domain-containing protein [Aeromicrobium sp.]|uniref:DUF4349 domain-containing protein n=1 Tax=Aeromicrobium sp. TaxID=1871063 RepID=UPI0025C44B55|nr:DUF4349 domain-containing protein [Aeromicrobium sp.]MCK5890066.1 DUF4349 domain-containing protein [Aeromicrobium sp.]
MSTGTVLDDQRIDDIRTRVMADVDADIRRRGRRTRVAAGGVAAAVVAVGLVVGTAAITTETGATSEFSSFPAPASGPEISPDVLSYRDDTPVPADLSDLTATEGQGPQVLPAEPGTAAERSVVTTGAAAVVVDDPAGAATDFGTWVEGAGGRIDSRSDQKARTSLTVRVPAGGVNGALDELRDLGELESSSLDRVDVTAQVVDLDARIAALQTSIARLTAILSEATTTADVVAAESNLTQRQAELDGLVAQRSALGEQVDLASLSVSFAETPTTATVEPDGFLGGLRTGWNSVVGTVNGVVTAAGVATPWLAIVLVLGVGAWVIARRRRTH